MSQTVAYTFVPSTAGLPAMLQRSDDAFIPLDLENSDYQAFLAWLAAGNPAPAGWTGPTNPAGGTTG